MIFWDETIRLTPWDFQKKTSCDFEGEKYKPCPTKNHKGKACSLKFLWKKNTSLTSCDFEVNKIQAVLPLLIFRNIKAYLLWCLGKTNYKAYLLLFWGKQKLQALLLVIFWEKNYKAYPFGFWEKLQGLPLVIFVEKNYKPYPFGFWERITRFTPCNFEVNKNYKPYPWHFCGKSYKAYRFGFVWGGGNYKG